MALVIESGNPTKFSASAVISTGPANLLGLFVTSASSTPTLEICASNTSGTSTVITQFTPGVGWYAMPIACKSGITVLVGGSVSGTAVWQPVPTGT